MLLVPLRRRVFLNSPIGPVEDSGEMRNLIEAVAEFNSDVDGVGGGEKVYRFEGEAAVNRFFNGLACIKRFGVLNRM